MTDREAPAPRLNLIYLYVRDMERSLTFYRDALGLPVQVSSGGTWAEVQLAGGLRFARRKNGAMGMTEESQRATFEVSGQVDASNPSAALDQLERWLRDAPIRVALTALRTTTRSGIFRDSRRRLMAGCRPRWTSSWTRDA